MSDSNYWIIGPEGTERNITALWSSIRLPFEPKGWLLEMRDSIRQKVMDMKAQKNQLLYGLFVSEDASSCDTENILFYNVGPRYFSHLSQHGICFDRLFDPPPVVGKYGTKPYFQYYSQIGLTDETAFWVKDNLLASWSNVVCPALKSELKPHVFWSAMKNGSVVIANRLAEPKFFGLNLRVNVPQGTLLNIAGVMKPLLDGIISAFHSHDGNNLAELAQRLAALSSQDQLDIEGMLTDRTLNCLGVRRLLHPFMRGVQWNPADDVCVSAKIVLNPSEGFRHFSFDGELYTVVQGRSWTEL